MRSSPRHDPKGAISAAKLRQKRSAVSLVEIRHVNRLKEHTLENRKAFPYVSSLHETTPDYPTDGGTLLSWTSPASGLAATQPMNS